MSNKDKTECPFEIDTDADEQKGWVWLCKTLEKIIEKGPSHRSYENALNCSKFFKRLADHSDMTHNIIHTLIDALNSEEMPDIFPARSFENLSNDEAKQALAELGLLIQRRGQA